MELTADLKLSREQLPKSAFSESSVLSDQNELSDNIRGLSQDEINEKIEIYLSDKISSGDKDAIFQMAQFYFEQENYEKSIKYFERAKEQGDLQAVFQLGVIYYDGLGCKADHKLGVENMKLLAASTSKNAKHLLNAAHYNLGRAYFQGYGVRRSDEEAEQWWILAADDGNPKASIKAQSSLGLFYSRIDSPNLKKAFFWHSEACGNGSLESQGALGVMYLNGLGCKQNPQSAFVCLREAAERGNVYAMGHLVAYYYKCKLYTKTLELAARVSQLSDVEQIASETDCLPCYVAKGIALASFYYARCLHMGFGIRANKEEANKFYSKCYEYDPDTCATLKDKTTHGVI